MTLIKGIKIHVRDNKPYVLENATKVANDYSATPEVIARHMRILFFHDWVTEDTIEIYNRLERKWKILTNYKTNETRAVSWE